MADEIERQSLASIADVYHSSALGGINEAYHLAVRDAMIPLKGGESALELGCGSGMWTRILCDRYDVVDVVDASAELLTRVEAACDQGRAKLRGHNLLVEEFAPAPSQQWEHVYITFLLEHVRDPVALLRQINSWLNPGGCLFIAVPNARSIHRELAVRMGLLESVDALSENDHRMGHRRVYTPALLREHVAAANYSIVRETYIGLKPLNLGQMSDYSEPLARALCMSGDLVGEHAAYIGIAAASN